MSTLNIPTVVQNADSHLSALQQCAAAIAAALPDTLRIDALISLQGALAVSLDEPGLYAETLAAWIDTYSEKVEATA